MSALTTTGGGFWGNLGNILGDTLNGVVEIGGKILSMEAMQELLERQRDMWALQDPATGWQDGITSGEPVTASSTPSWVLPVAIGGGVTVLALIAILATRGGKS